jgi:transposase InsO family protein
MTAGRCAGRPRGSRSGRSRRPAGRSGTGSTGRRGWRATGRVQGHRNRAATPGTGRSRYRNPLLGYSYLHTAIDDYSRLACTEILVDESKDTGAAFWARAQAWFTAAGITVERIMTDNGSCYLSHTWRDALAAVGITHERTAPTGHRPTVRSNASTAPSWTNGLTPGIYLRDRTARHP